MPPARAGLRSAGARAARLAAPVFLAFVLVADAAEPARPLGPEEHARIAAKLFPARGYTLPITWADLGPRLVRVGAIDVRKFRALYRNGQARLPADFVYLERSSADPIRITRENAAFLVNVFWALGLANKSPVLERMAAERGTDKLMSLASTGGWTLGSRPPAALYGKFEIVPLTAKQHALVATLARTIYRPCCDNATAFPDCNHGMALLGLIEFMAASGLGHGEILKAGLQVNSFWFPQQYLKTAFLFHLRGLEWDAVDARQALGLQYSGLSGWTKNVDEELKKLAHLLPPGAGGAVCGISP